MEGWKEMTIETHRGTDLGWKPGGSMMGGDDPLREKEIGTVS